MFEVSSFSQFFAGSYGRLLCAIVDCKGLVKTGNCKHKLDFWLKKLETASKNWISKASCHSSLP
jgi:hypothetical protein